MMADAPPLFDIVNMVCFRRPQTPNSVRRKTQSLFLIILFSPEKNA